MWPVEHLSPGLDHPRTHWTSDMSDAACLFHPVGSCLRLGECVAPLVCDHMFALDEEFRNLEKASAGRVWGAGVRIRRLT